MLSFLVLTLALEAGSMPNFAIVALPMQYHKSLFYQNTKIGLQAFDMAFVELETETKSEKGSSWYFAPVNANYSIRTGVKLAGFTVGFEHMCAHPVLSTSKENGLQTMNLYQSWDKLYVRYETKFNL